MDSPPKKAAAIGEFPALATLLVGLVVGAYLCLPISKPAYFGHLTFGNWIYAAGAVPKENIWTKVGLGQRWMDESWLFDVALSFFENHFRQSGIAVFKLLLFFAVPIALGFLFSRRAGNYFFGGLLAVLVSCGVLDQMSLEPILAAVACFSVSLFLREKYLSDATKLQPLILLFVVTAIFGNIDFSVVLIVVLIFLPASALPDGGIKKLLLPAALLISPYLGRQLLQGAEGALTSMQQALSYRNLTLSVFDFGFCFLLLIWMFVVCLAFSGRKRKVSAEDIFIGLVSVAALAFKPLLPFALILSGLLAASNYRAIDDTVQSNLLIAIQRAGAALGRLPLVGSAFLLLCLLFTLCVGFFRDSIVDSALPRQALDYFQEKNLPEPIFHEADISPYIIYRFSDVSGRPRRLAAFDRELSSRDREMGESELALREWNVGWEKIFTAVSPKTVLARTYTPLYEALRRDADWQLVFEGDSEIQASEDLVTRKVRPFTWALFTKQNR